jgi:hypothetical protein
VRLPRLGIAEFVVLLLVVIELPVLRLPKECPQRKMDGLSPVVHAVPMYHFLDQVVVDFDLDRLQHGPTIPAAFELRTWRMTAIGVPVGRVLDEQ